MTMKTFNLSNGISRYWWLPLIAGLVCIGLGVWTICTPAEALPLLADVFAICLVVAGVLDCSFGIATSRFNSQWGWNLAIGILDLIAGIWMLTLPEPTITVVFMYIVGIWILIAAINSICASLALTAYSPVMLVWVLLLLIATAFMAIWFLSTPLIGGVAVWLWIAISFICYGVYRVTEAFHIKSVTTRK